jgi:hypothetical protein
MVICRICLEEEDLSNNTLIAPCRCDGNSKYVHRECLAQWRLTSPRAFSKCAECNFKYLLDYEYALETCTFEASTRRRTNTGEYMFTLMLIMISGFFFRNIGKALNYPSLLFLNMISRNKLGDDFNEEILILKEDEIASGCYYFSVANFFSSFVLLTYFLLKTSVKIRRVCTYWDLIFFRFFLVFMYSLHLPWSYMVLSWDRAGFSTFVISDAVFSIFNLRVYMLLLEYHNKVVTIMNTSKNKTRLVEPPRVDAESQRVEAEEPHVMIEI